MDLLSIDEACDALVEPGPEATRNATARDEVRAVDVQGLIQEYAELADRLHARTAPAAHHLTCGKTNTQCDCLNASDSDKRAVKLVSLVAFAIVLEHARDDPGALEVFVRRFGHEHNATLVQHILRTHISPYERGADKKLTVTLRRELCDALCGHGRAPSPGNATLAELLDRHVNFKYVDCAVQTGEGAEEVASGAVHPSIANVRLEVSDVLHVSSIPHYTIVSSEARASYDPLLYTSGIEFEDAKISRPSKTDVILRAMREEERENWEGGEDGLGMFRAPVELEGHGDYVFSSDFSPHSNLIYTASKDGHVRCFSMGEPFTCRAAYRIHLPAECGSSGSAPPVPCWQVSAHPSDFYFAVATASENVVVCHIETGVRLTATARSKLTIRGAREARSRVFAAKPSAKGAAGGGKSTQLPSTPRPRNHINLKGHEAPDVDLLQWHPVHPAMLFSGSASDKTVRLWDIRKPDRPSATFYGPTEYLSTFAFSPGSAPLLAVGTAEGTVNIWDVRKPQFIAPFSTRPHMLRYQPDPTPAAPSPIYTMLFDTNNALYVSQQNRLHILRPHAEGVQVREAKDGAERIVLDPAFGSIVHICHTLSEKHPRETRLVTTFQA